MAPSLQQRLQGAWDKVSAAVIAQPSLFDTQAHCCNFLQSLVDKASSPSQKHSSFRLHIPFPFAGLFLNRSKSKLTFEDPTSPLADSNHDGFLRQNHPFVNRSGEESLPSSKWRHSLSEEEHAPGVGGDLVRQNYVSLSKNGEEGLRFQKRGPPVSEEDHVSGGDGPRSPGNQINYPTELQLLHMQLETPGLESSAPASKEVLGRATWTFLHTLAAQFPEKPTRQQQRDAKELMAILSRLYPCKECADHFKEVLKSNPVQAGSGVELAQWMCAVHNIVNRSLGKPLFPCRRVDARWGAMECDEGACNLQGRLH